MSGTNQCTDLLKREEYKLLSTACEIINSEAEYPSGAREEAVDAMKLLAETGCDDAIRSRAKFAMTKYHEQASAQKGGYDEASREAKEVC